MDEIKLPGRAVVEDRYLAAMLKGATESKLQRRLDSVVWDIIKAVARRPLEEDDSDCVQHVDDAIHDLIVDYLSGEHQPAACCVRAHPGWQGDSHPALAEEEDIVWGSGPVH